jgi:hypothetical protein
MDQLQDLAVASCESGLSGWHLLVGMNNENTSLLIEVKELQ